MKKPEKTIIVRYTLPESAHQVIRDHRLNMQILSKEDVTLENALIDLLLNKTKIDKPVLQAVSE